MTDANLSLTQAERVDAVCDRFEAEWRAGRTPRIEDYLAAVPERDREALRAALLGVERELRRAAPESTCRDLLGPSAVDTQAAANNPPPASADTPSGTRPEEPIPERIGRFEVREVLGTGAFGRVYRAWDPQLGRDVALKVPLPDTLRTPADRERFLREARAAARLHHPNICPIHEVGEEDGTPFLVMACIPGPSLAAVLKDRAAPLPQLEAVRIARKLAAALAAAHRKGIVHRDLKPANVLFDAERDEVVVADFGLARGPQLSEARVTQSGAVLGTPAYMAPEQARGDGRAVGPSSDVFSLGVILYEMLAGRRPFRGTATEVLGQVLHVEPEPPSRVRPEIDPRLEAACLKALAKDPAARFASMEAFAAALDDYLRAPVAKGRDTARGLLVVAALLLLALLPLGYLFGGILLRFATNKGELVIEADDPNVEVTVRGGSVVLHDKVKDRRFVLTAGDYEVDVREEGDGGVRFTTKQFTIIRGGKETLNVRLELAKAAPAEPRSSAPAARPDKEKPFVLLRQGGQREEFQRFEAAVTVLQDGDILEVHGNGPFTIGRVELRGKGLRMRAASGYRPRFLPALPLGGAGWFSIQEAEVRVEGCDFQFVLPGRSVFRGGGAAWEFRNCRFVGDCHTLGNAGEVAACVGPSLRFEDCLVSVWGNLVLAGPRTEVEVSNCLVKSEWAIYVRSSLGGQAIRFRDSTMFGGLLGVNFIDPPGSTDPVTIEAVGNVVQTHDVVMKFGAGPKVDKDFKSLVRWRGRDNLFVNRLFSEGNPSTLFRIERLADWQKFWGQDEGSRQVARVCPAWSHPQRESPEATLKLLRELTEQLRRQPGPKELGPDWDLIGPGEAYVRALGAAGRPVPKEQLRPPAPAEGPFVLFRQGKPVGGHVTLTAAVRAAENGDVIEVRSDEPFAGDLGGDAARTLTLRAAPGYRPVHVGPAVVKGPWTVEGIHFRATAPGDRLLYGLDASAIARVANCSFEGANLPLRRAGRGDTVEIVNCLIAGDVNFSLKSDRKLRVQNSLVGTCGSSRNVQSERGSRLELERSIVWDHHSGEACIHPGDSTVSARHTVFQGDLVVATMPPEWSGSGNLYRLRASQWAGKEQPPPGSLADWRRRWNSDADSTEADPMHCDSSAWRLLPHSPGYRQGPNGKDQGADVDRVARPTAGNGK